MGAHPLKRTVSLTLRAAQVEEAKALGLNLSQISDAAIEQAVRAARYDRWRDENKHVLEAQEAWIRAHGHPLAEIARGPLAGELEPRGGDGDAPI